VSIQSLQEGFHVSRSSSEYSTSN